MNERFDVVIVGGGPSGTATALTLAQRGLSVALLERSHYESTRIGETLPPIAHLPLVQLGVWDRFIAMQHAASPGTCSAWGAVEPYEESFIFSPFGHGWHLDRRSFDAMLASSAEEAGTSVFRRARLTACHHRAAGGWSVEFDANGEPVCLEAVFIVEASGRASGIVRRLGAKRIGYDRLIGLVRFFPSHANGDESDQRTLVEAVEDGWWYSARLPDNRLITAFMTDADLRPNAHELLDRFLQTRLKKAPLTCSRVSELEQNTEVVVVAANSSRLRSVTGVNWLAVGDAACAYDPLSSLGICCALESGVQAGCVIDDYLRGKQAALMEYERWVAVRFEEYLKIRMFYYYREQRWPNSPFWQRRHSPEQVAEAMLSDLFPSSPIMTVRSPS